jgi:hypothetical protein
VVDHRMDGGGLFNPAPAFAAVASITSASSDLLATDAGKYLRFNAASAASLTVRPDATHALPANGEWHIRNIADDDLTLVAGSGVAINPPAGGTLVVATNMTVTLKRVSTDVFDLIGQTVPESA